MIYISITDKGDLMQPITAIIDFFKSMPYYAKGLSVWSEDLVPEIPINSS